jgi:hypothetical protein
MCFICFYDKKYRQYYEVLGDQEMWREAYLIFGLLNEVSLLAPVTYVPKNSLIDDVHIEGLSRNVGHIDLRQQTVNDLANVLIEKIENSLQSN